MKPPHEAWNSLNSEQEKAHGENWRRWLGHLAGQPAKGLELGTWLGESAEWMLQNIFTHPEARYRCVDTFEGSEEHHMAGVDCSTLEAQARARLAQFNGRCWIYKGRTDTILRMLNRGVAEFDFIYVDAAHDALNVMRDAVLAFDLLKVEGVMVFDDLTWAVMPDPLDCPKLAIDAFVAIYARRVEVIGIGTQLALRKTS